MLDLRTRPPESRGAAHGHSPCSIKTPAPGFKEAGVGFKGVIVMFQAHRGRRFGAALLAASLGSVASLASAPPAAAINLFYHMAMQTIVFRKGVRGPGLTSTEQLAAAWNIHTWEMD